MFHFYAPRKRQKTFGFLIFSGDVEIELKWIKTFSTFAAIQKLQEFRQAKHQIY